MPISIPETHLDLLDRPIVAALATILPDGQPQVNCVWCLYEMERMLMFTIQGTQKEKNMRKRPVATMLFADPQNPFRYLEVRGEVEAVTEEGAETLADRLTQKYMNLPQYFGTLAPLDQKGKITLLACKIRPTRVVAVG